MVTEIIRVDNDSTFRHLYLYDLQGKKMLETVYFQENSEWVRKNQTEWLYNDENCIMQRERIWKNGEWVVVYVINYEYNGTLLIRETHNSYPEKNELLVREIVYSYNMLNKRMYESKQYDYENGELKKVIKKQFSFLNLNKTDSVLTTVSTTKKLICQYLSVLTYNTNKTVSTQLLKEKKPDSDWQNLEFVNWYYMPDGLTVKSQRLKRWINDIQNWENSQRIDYEYNSSGAILSETYQYWKTMFWQNDLRYDYKYENDKLLNKLYRCLFIMIGEI